MATAPTCRRLPPSTLFPYTTLFRSKRATAPRAGEAALPVLLLVHGSSNSGRVSFDLATPGRGEYSVMNEFSRLGFDTWTLDRKSTRLNSSHPSTSYAVFCLKKKTSA